MIQDSIPTELLPTSGCSMAAYERAAGATLSRIKAIAVVGMIARFINILTTPSETVQQALKFSSFNRRLTVQDSGDFASMANRMNSKSASIGRSTGADGRS